MNTRSNTAPIRSRFRPTPSRRVSGLSWSTICLQPGARRAASHALLRQVGAEVVAAAFIIELSFLGGRQRLDLPITSLVAYDS